jgi:hypothetical protein
VGLALVVACVLGILLLFVFGGDGQTQETQGPQPDHLQEDVLQQPIRV